MPIVHPTSLTFDLNKFKKESYHLRPHDGSINGPRTDRYYRDYRLFFNNS